VTCPTTFASCTTQPYLYISPDYYQDAVVDLQCLLNQKANAGLETNGWFDSTRRDAVVEWQKEHFGLFVNGDVWSDTWVSLCDAVACPSFSGYVFWPGYDSSGYDIHDGGVGRNLASLTYDIADCSATSACKGLTTSGYLKSYIKPARGRMLGLPILSLATACTSRNRLMARTKSTAFA
jgi:hypothetical protein